MAVADGNFYTSNAGSASLSQFRDTGNGVLSFESNFSTDPGTVDAAGPANSPYLYVQTGASGILDEFESRAERGVEPDRFAHRVRSSRWRGDPRFLISSRL